MTYDDDDDAALQRSPRAGGRTPKPTKSRAYADLDELDKEIADMERQLTFE